MDIHTNVHTYNTALSSTRIPKIEKYTPKNTKWNVRHMHSPASGDVSTVVIISRHREGRETSLTWNAAVFL